jgi:hypothetical protein
MPVVDQLLLCNRLRPVSAHGHLGEWKTLRYVARSTTSYAKTAGTGREDRKLREQSVALESAQIDRRSNTSIVLSTRLFLSRVISFFVEEKTRSHSHEVAGQDSVSNAHWRIEG